MDQESFRRLLQTPRPGASTTPTTSRGSLLASTSKPKTADPSQPSFKPRKVKKSSDSKYRDRAAERRVGEGNDYAQVEAVLEDFERRVAQTEDKTTVEEQRRYLGGDSDHSILVKGLDVALLEQNKARAAMSTEDDDSLEQAFLEVSSEPAVPKKRTREDLIRELKEKRGQPLAVEGTTKKADEEVRLLEEAKKAGKFKPIGFKPIGAPAVEKSKKSKTKGEGKDGERKKKKRKVEVGSGEKEKQVVNGEKNAKGEMLPPPLPTKKSSPPPPALSSSAVVEPEPEPIAEDFDIFAGAGEYEGIDLGDDDENEETKDSQPEESEEQSTPSEIKPGQWFADDEPEPLPTVSQPEQSTSKSRSPPPQTQQEEDEEGEVEQPVRLVPLQSSALPSIKDFLAMDEAAGALEKRRKRKEKRKGGKGGGDDDDDDDSKKLSAEVKADRDYKRLKSYQEKKAGASTTK